MLYMSIPCSEGWKAYVDGRETEVLKANLSYMAVPIEAGTHTVVFKYMTPLMDVGAVITVLTAAVILIYYLIKRRKKYPERVQNGLNE